jgi:hypothetical protein
MNLLNYQTAFVCYFDVLGIRSFIKNKDRVELYFSFIVDDRDRIPLTVGIEISRRFLKRRPSYSGSLLI